MRFRAVLIVACSGACSGAFCQQAQKPLPGEVYRPGNGVTPPVVIGKADPEYSEEARIARLAGTVWLSLVVGEDGNVRDIRDATSLGLGLDEKAVDAVSRWRFRPGLKDGMPVPVGVNVEINFRLLEERGAWALSRAAFNPPEGAARPVLTSASYPPVDTTSGPNRSVAISFDVNPDGMAENLHIEKSSGPGAESEVIRIVRGWQFRPGIKDSQPVSVPCTLEFISK
jgi:TonB family protein